MSEELLRHYLDIIKLLISEKKIRFIVGKVNTGIQIKISPSEVVKYKIDVQLLQNLLPLFFQIATSKIMQDMNSALEAVSLEPMFSDISQDIAVDLIHEAIVTNEFKRNYFHRISTVSVVLESLEAQYIIKPSQKKEITPDIPSIQFIMRSRGTTRIEDNFESSVDLSVDDIELLFNFFSDLRNNLREKTKDTLFHIQEND